MSRRDRAVAAVAAGVLLAGCTGTVTGRATFGGEDPAKPDVAPAEPAGRDPAADPVVGTCRTIAEGQDDDPRDPPDPVACWEEHDAETAAVDDSGLGGSDPYPTARDVADEDGAAATALDGVCTRGVLTAYLGGDDLDEPYASVAPYLPSEEQWAAGARWVRCDVLYGYSSPETAPGILAGALKGPDAAAYRACFVGDPAGWSVVPCARPHDAEPIGAHADVPDGPAYPADPPARQALAQQCFRDVGAYVGGPMPAGYALDVYVGTESQWADRPRAQCVLVPAHGGQTSTSVRG
jgi:hypothetical protein